MQDAVEGVLAGAVASVVALVLLALLPAAWGWQAYTVVSGSMAPAVVRGDVVVAAPAGGGPVREGEVVVLAPWQGEGPGGRATAPITHRVLDLLPSRRFRTKGDANPGPDGRVSSWDDVIARPRYVVPLVGRLTLLGPVDRLVAVAVALLAVGLGAWAQLAPRPATPPAQRAMPPPRGRPARRTSWIRRTGSLVLAAGCALAASQVVRPPTAGTFSRSSSTRAQSLATRSAFYPVAVKASLPVAYWRLGESSGTTATDAMGVAPMTLVNSPTLGRPGALTGDGNTAVGVRSAGPSYGSASAAALAISGPLTVAVWTKVASVTTNVRLVFKGTSATLNYLLAWSSGGTDMRFLVDPVSGSRITAQGTWPTDQAWHFVVGVYDGTTARLYLDGVQVGTGTSNLSSNLKTNTADLLTVSEQPRSGSIPMTGDVDELAVWSRALPAAEVLALYRDGTGA